MPDRTDDGMNEAERLLHKTFFRSSDAWGLILSFRAFVEAGTPTAMSTLGLAVQAYISDQLKRPAGQSIFKVDAMKPGDAEQIARMMVEGRARDAQSAVDAASFVFAHTMLDSAAMDYCRVVAMLDPEAWLDSLKGRMVTLVETKDSSFRQLLRGAVDRYLDQLERESLLLKIDKLYSMCPPPLDPSLRVRGYNFDRDRLERLDKLRHAIIHGDALGKPVPNAAAELDFLLKTSTHLLTMVAVRFDLKIDPSYLRTYYAERAQRLREGQAE